MVELNPLIHVVERRVIQVGRIDEEIAPWAHGPGYRFSGGGAMATVKFPVEVEGSVVGSETLTADVDRKVLQMRRDVRASSELDGVQTSGWCYWMPFPGVRYFSYVDHPSPVERVMRSR